MAESNEEKLQQLQMVEQNLQGFLSQRQQFQMQLVEIESALGELKGKDKAYRIIGSIMVESKASDIQKDLGEKKSMLELRISNLEKQESRLKDKAKQLREDVLSGLKSKQKG